MSYFRRVVKRRPLTLTNEEWFTVFNRGKCPREGFRPRDGLDVPPVDVSDLLFQRALSHLRRRVEQLCMALQKPSTSRCTDGQSSSTAHPGQMLSQFSELWEFLSRSAYADGSTRIPGTISLKCASAGIQVTLTDPSSSSYCCQTASSLDDAFLALEVGLKEGTLPWRASGYAKGKK